MRFTLVLSGLFAALAAAAESGTRTAAAPASSVSLDPAQQSQINCLKACDAGDVNCQAHCIGVPSPDQSQVNATTACVAKCPQGNGSAAQTQVYKLCIDKCVNEHYFVTSEGTPAPTGSPGNDHAASGTGTDTAAAPTGTSGSGSGGSDSDGSDSSSTGTATKGGSATKTGSAASQTTTNAAPAIVVSGSALAGVIAALLAL
ncbi:hypothetical protein V8C42DRAFT_320340 [Trichoderma barbatum]